MRPPRPALTVMPLKVRKSLCQAMFRLRSRRLHQDAALEIRALEGRGDGGMIVFTSYHANAAKRGLLEFASSASDGGARHCIFVTDRRQGWFQGEGLAQAILRAVSDYVRHHGLRRLMTVGVSMGGYGALSFAAALGAGRALALAPQFCPRPQTFPADRRWIETRSRIEDFTRPALDQAMGGDIRYTLLHGRRNPEDARHWQAFPQGPGIHHYLTDRDTHDVVDPLRAAGILYPVIDAVWKDDQDRVNTLMQRIRAVPRAWGERALDLHSQPAAAVSCATS